MPKTNPGDSARDLKLKNDGLKNLSLEGNIQVAFPEMNNTVLFSLEAAGIDSMLLTLSGPFGITVGKLYCEKDYFMFYNVLENSLYEGTPTSSNLSEMVNLPLSYSDLVLLLRCEVPGNPDYFRIDENYGKDGFVLLQNKSMKDYYEYVQLDEEKLIRQYQRKTSNGSIVLNVLYKKYEKFDKANVAERMEFEFPSVNGRISIQNTSIKVNNETGPLKFSVPGSVSRRNLDRRK